MKEDKRSKFYIIMKGYLSVGNVRQGYKGLLPFKGTVSCHHPHLGWNHAIMCHKTRLRVYYDFLSVSECVVVLAGIFTCGWSAVRLKRPFGLVESLNSFVIPPHQSGAVILAFILAQALHYVLLSRIESSLLFGRRILRRTVDYFDILA